MGAVAETARVKYVQELLQHERWQYRYDAFGRRIRKRRLDSVKAVAGYDYRWSGDQLVVEVPVYANDTVAMEKSIYWLYEPGALTPGARMENGERREPPLTAIIEKELVRKYALFSHMAHIPGVHKYGMLSHPNNYGCPGEWLI